MEEKDLFAYNLTMLRKQKGKTQQEIADTFSYTFQAVSRWETGKSLPDAITLKKIAEYYNVDLDFFFQEHEEFKLTEEEKFIIKRKSTLEQIGLLLMCIFIVAGISYFIIFSIPTLDIANFVIIADAFFICSLAFSYIFKVNKYRTLLYSLIVWSTLSGFYFIYVDEISGIELIIFYGFLIQVLILWIQRRVHLKK